MSNDIAEMMRETLIRVDAAEAARPGTAPDWARIDRMINHRGRLSPRLRWITILAAAMAVILVAGGILAGVVPRVLGRADDAADAHRKDGHSALYQQPTKGSLADDGAWLSALTGYLYGPELYAAGALAKARPQADSIRVLFAGDVGGHRAALVEGNWTTPADGPDPHPWQFWLGGPAGAQPDALSLSGPVPSRATAPPDVATHLFGGSWYELANPVDTSRPGRFIVVSARPVPVRVVDDGITLAADGSVRFPHPAVRGQDGVYTGTAGGYGKKRTYLFISGQFAAAAYGSRTWGLGSQVPMSPAQRIPVRGGDEALWPVLPAATNALELVYLGDKLADAIMANREDGTYQILASAPPADATGQTGQSVVSMFTYPSGARVIAAQGVNLHGEQPGKYGGMSYLGEQIVPAGTSTDDLSIAWVEPVGYRRVSMKGPVTGWSGAMGPKGTATVVWVHQDGHRTSSRAVHTIATTRSIDVTQARFLDASGREIGTAGIAPTVTDAGIGWVLEPVAKALASG